jgi:hypothetical protein
MMPKEKLRHADVVTAVLLMLLSLAVMIGAGQMPLRGTYGGVVNVWYVSPAALPFVIGMGLFLMALHLLRFAIDEGGHRGILRFFGARARTLRGNTPVHRMLGVVLLLGIYVYGLIGRIDYYLASILYLVAFMALYAHREGPRWRHWVKIFVLGILVPLAVGYGFREYLFVPLP